MLIVAKKRYKKQHVIGGSGIFDTIINFAKRLLTSGAAKSLASSAAKQAGKHIVNNMLQAAPPVTYPAPQIPTFQPPLRSETPQIPAPTLTQKSKEDLSSLIHRPATNLNNLMMSGNQTGSAVKIQDLVKRGSGMKKIIN
jgi:hypothetical protein